MVTSWIFRRHRIGRTCLSAPPVKACGTSSRKTSISQRLLDQTNISVNYEDKWLMQYFADGDLDSVFIENVHQAMRTAEPGFSFNFFDKENETLRNAFTEVTSADDSDVCNLGSINMSRVKDIREMAEVVELATKFLICGTLKAKLPYDKVELTRAKNRRLGLGLMGMHEWLIQKGEQYEVITGWQFIKGFLTKSPKQPQTDSPSADLLPKGRSLRQALFAVSYKRRYL